MVITLQYLLVIQTRRIFREVGCTVFIILADASFGAVCGIGPIPPPATGGAPFDVPNENMSSPKREDVSREVSSLGGVAEDIVPLLGGVGPYKPPPERFCEDPVLVVVTVDLVDFAVP